MTKTTTRVLAGVAVAALAAAAVAAVIRYRQGQTPDPDESAQLDELEARLYEVEEPDKDIPPIRVGRVVEDLQRNQGISVPRLRQWITGLMVLGVNSSGDHAATRAGPASWVARRSSSAVRSLVV
jgi:hypothetical protein